MRPRIAAGLVVLVSACSDEVVQTLLPGEGVQIASGKVSVDDSKVPVLPTCGEGQIVGKGANGWECFTPAKAEVLQGGEGIRIENGTISAKVGTEAGQLAAGNHDHDGVYRQQSDLISWSEVDAAATDVWPGTVPYAQLTDVPAINWNTIGTSVTPTTPWPGTLSYSQLTNVPAPYSDLQAVAAVKWDTVSLSVKESDPWPGRVDYAQIDNPPTIPPEYTDERARTAVKWEHLSTSVTAANEWPGTVPFARISETPTEWPGTVPYARVTGAPADVTADVAALKTSVQGLLTRVQALETQNETLSSRVTRLEQADCPTGYTRDLNETTIVLCKKALSGGGFDEMVRVADFWIDRFEISACNGAACSRSGMTPTEWVDFHLGASMCAASGKRLCSNAEWQLAATGTPDPATPSNGNSGSCLTQASAPRVTGQGSQCRSTFGAEDMIGNQTELVSDWLPAGTTWVSSDGTAAEALPFGTGGDGTSGVNSRAYVSGSRMNGMLASVIRGGAYEDGTRAGLGHINMVWGPYSAWKTTGTRCCSSR